MSETSLQQRYFYGLPLKKMLRALTGNTKIDSVKICGETFQVETVTDTEKLLNIVENETFHIDERLPYWSELWPSSFALAEYILEHKEMFKHKRTLEVGCGLGLCGLAARIAGANVEMTDYDPLALYFARRNDQRNFTGPARVYYLDWRGPYPEGKFDIIIGADVVYEKKFFRPLFHLVDTMLSTKGHFIYAEPQRSVAQDFSDLFAGEIWTSKFTEKIVKQTGRTNRVNIHHRQR